MPTNASRRACRQDMAAALARAGMGTAPGYSQSITPHMRTATMDPKLEGFVWGLWVGVPVGWMLLALLSAAIDDRKARTREVES